MTGLRFIEDAGLRLQHERDVILIGTAGADQRLPQRP